MPDLHDPSSAPRGVLQGRLKVLQRLTARVNFQSDTGLWMGAAFAAALVLAFVVLAAIGTGERGVSVAVQLTGRLMFLLFWLAYTGRAIVALFGPVLAMLERRVRDFGLCFASVLLVHLGLVAWLFRISASQPIPDSSVLLFSLGVVSTLVLTMYSMRRLRDTLNPKFRRILRVVAVEYIAFLFLVDLVLKPIQNSVKHPIAYVPFSIMILAGLLLRLTARTRPLWRGKRVQISPSSPA